MMRRQNMQQWLRPCAVGQAPAFGVFGLGRQRHSGFSLLEILVAVTVVVILAALSVPSVMDWQYNQQLRATTQEIIQTLGVARSGALKNNASVCFDFEEKDGKIAGWRVFEDADGSVDYSDGDTMLAESSLEGRNIVITKNRVANASCDFRYRGNGFLAVNNNGSVSVSADVALTHVQGKGVRCIRVSATGRVREDKPGGGGTCF